MLERPGTPKCILTVGWERLGKAMVWENLSSHLWQNFDSIPREAGGIQSKWVMFCASIAEAAARSFGRKVSWW